MPRADRAGAVALGLLLAAGAARATEPGTSVVGAPATAAATAAPSRGRSAAKDDLVARLLAEAGPATRAVLAAPETYRFQVLYSEVAEAAATDAGSERPAQLVRHGLRLDAEYYFPASAMKLPIVLAAYERLAALRGERGEAFDRDALLTLRPATGEPTTTTLARDTWRALVVSDNAAANRILAFAGHRETNEALWALGLASARVHTGFLTGEEREPYERSPELTLAGPKGTASLPARTSTLKLPPTDARKLAIGEAYLENGRLVRRPLSFADKNAIRLRELQDALVRLVRPDLLPEAAAADRLAPEDRELVKTALGTLPSESGLAGFDRNVVADYPLVPFLRGLERVRPRGRFQIFSKVGQAFGFLIGNAYVVDKETGRSFFLTAAIFANPDGVLNDDVYAYDTVSFPVLADVAERIARHAFAAANPAPR